MAGIKGWHLAAAAAAWILWEHSRASRAAAGVSMTGGAALAGVPKGSKDATGAGEAVSTITRGIVKDVLATPGIADGHSSYKVSIQDEFFHSRQQGTDGGALWSGGFKPEYLL